MYKYKMDEKIIKTVACNWIQIDDVTDDRCEAESIEDLLKNVLDVFAYRCNLLL